MRQNHNLKVYVHLLEFFFLSCLLHNYLKDGFGLVKHQDIVNYLICFLGEMLCHEFLYLITLMHAFCSINEEEKVPLVYLDQSLMFNIPVDVVMMLCFDMICVLMV